MVLLRGLSERSFTKYVPWAYRLWRSTGAAVALLPLPFHPVSSPKVARCGGLPRGWATDEVPESAPIRSPDRGEHEDEAGVPLGGDPNRTARAPPLGCFHLA